MRLYGLLAVAIVTAFSVTAQADDRLGNKSFKELNSYTSAPASGDLTVMYDLSADKLVKRDASTYYPATVSTALTSNPFVQSTYNLVTLAELNSSKTILASAASKAIKVNSFQILSSGTMGGLTTAVLECSGGADLASFTSAALVNQTVLGPYSSGVTLSSSLVNGCPAGESVIINKTGSAGTTASHVKVNVQYTWQ